MRYLTLVLLLLSCLPMCCTAGPSALDTENATVMVHPDQVTDRLAPQLFGVNLSVGDKARIASPETVKLVQELDIGSVRFPNGCQADRYNWLEPGEKQVTVDEFLRFCDRIDAEPYYTINMQGGTEGLEGPIPKSASLEERIRYRHTAPNPCGDTNYYFGTLEETKKLVQKYTVDRALEGKRPILFYEMGNENWGQARTDWPPDVYARTVEVYATAMREVVEGARAQHPQLADLKLRITAVGYPVMGNNQKMTDTPDYRINTDWTKRLNDLHKRGVIDAVQEHFYPYGYADGGTLAWVNHNLANIFDARLGLANPRLGGYKDRKLVYRMPMEITEWNVKCWGTGYTSEVVSNPGFEDDLTGWHVAGNASVEATPKAPRRGHQGLWVGSREGEWCEVSQRFRRGDFSHATAAVWVRTNRPGAVQVLIRETNEMANIRKPLGQAGTPPNPSMWHRLVVSGKMEDDTTEFELVFRVEGDARAVFDEVMLLSLKSTSGIRPLSAETFEQQLFCVDALRMMAEKGVRRAHIHHLFGTYPCGLVNQDGTIRENYRVFDFFGGFRGDRLVKTTCTAGTFRYDHSARSYATDFNALAPTVEAAPAFSAQASRTDDMLYLLLINRYSDRAVVANIDLGARPIEPTGVLRTLTGTDIDLAGCVLEESPMEVRRKFEHRIEPYSAQILAVRIR